MGAFLNRKGAEFRVWAPFAESVSLVGNFSNWAPIPMISENNGYWYLDLPNAHEGQEYKFEITYQGKKFLRNDPRALHFTTNSGNSVLAGGDFDWQGDDFTPPPYNQQVIYELHVGTFNRPEPYLSGNFDTLIQKLDHLQNLGVNMIELMPISSMLMDRGWGYAIDYIFAVESLYGGRHGFLNFVKSAHQRGIGVIVDVVYNHFGPDEHLDLWQFDGWNQDGKGGIYFYNDWRAETPWGNTRPDFGRPEVRQYILDNVKMWINDCHVDGLRVDSTIYLRNVYGRNNDPSTDLPEAWQFLQDLNNEVKKIKPSAIVIGEDVADNEYITKPTSEGGAGFDSQWELNFPFALRDALSPTGIDLSRVLGELNKRYNDDPFERVIFSDSHDSAANGRSRMNEDLYPGKAQSFEARKKILIANTVMLTTPGIPMLFQGQEFAEDGSFNDWRGLDWQKAEKFAGLVKAHSDLISLRKNSHNISGGLTGKNINLSHMDEVNKVIAYHRWGVGGPKDDVLVIVNFGPNDVADYVLGFPRLGEWKVRFDSSNSDYNSESTSQIQKPVVVETGGGTVQLKAYSALILSQDN